MINWKIENMIRNVNDGGVTRVYWKASIEEDYTVGNKTHEIRSEITGNCKFGPDTSSDTFIAFENLTEETVLNWVFQVVNKGSLEEKLESMVEEEKSKIPLDVGGLPW